jgi:hypothetical protein
MFTLPRELAGMAAALKAPDRDGRRVLAEIGAGRRFDPRVPLLLHRLCTIWAGECLGRALILIVLCGFAVPLPKRAWRLLRALALILPARFVPRSKVWALGSAAPPPTWPELVRPANPARVWTGPLPPQLSTPTTPSDCPKLPRGSILTRV